MNWRAINCWFCFSFFWSLTIFVFVGRWFILCAFVGALVGFLSLCALDIWQAHRHHRALREDARRKREGVRQ